MKKLLVIILGLIVVLIIIYMNRSYAHIYNKINDENLLSSNMKQTYNFKNNSGEKLNYVAMGDSLTAGVGVNSFEKSFPYKVAEMISNEGKNVTLNIQALPGAKSVDIINLYVEPTIKLNPDLITVFVGVNDVHGNITEDEFKNNYKIILNKLTKETKAKIYIINLPYIGDDKLILPPYNTYFNNRTQEFNRILKQLADEYDLDYVDLYTPTYKPSIEKYYSKDSFHPSDVGYKLWSEIIYDGIN